MTQALSGHGCFGAYLHKYKRRRSAACQDCGTDNDDAEHSIYDCEAHADERVALTQEMGAQLSPDTMISLMLQSQSAWDLIASYLRLVIRKKRATEKERAAIEDQMDSTQIG